MAPLCRQSSVWVELLKVEPSTEQIAVELEKDVARLQVVTERFSKIGSQPRLELNNLSELLRKSVDYFESRSRGNVDFIAKIPNDVMAVINEPLFEWVIENLIKNALDAMDGKGQIVVEVDVQETRILIDVSDTGKGIAQSKFKSVFQPGYTSKKRGWGLGLSLSKRIVKDYHRGKIYVLKSEPNSGTTFRISLKR